MTANDGLSQAGIFALGTASHAYLEFDLAPGRQPRDLAVKLASLREPRTTIGGVNLVAGFRPELWRDRLGMAAPENVRGFDKPLVGPDGFSMPATQHDALLWLAGAAYDVVFDVARDAINILGEVAVVASEVSSWPYRHDRDLTGFIDGTENPSVVAAPQVALVPPGTPGAGGSVLLLQRWGHDVAAWEALGVEGQEKAMGRTKDASVELDVKPETSHVARTDQDQHGHIFRRNMPYGTVTDHGTMFVGFSADQAHLADMLESMVGLRGPRDELTRYTAPLTGAYYFVPALDAIASLAPSDTD